ncbi:MAG TPA: cytochrome c [Rhodoblastus sp.]|nr:cytochrome c [Rhodoblastus sp.]
MREMPKRNSPLNPGPRALVAAALAFTPAVTARAQGGGRELTVGKTSMVEACAPCHGADGVARDAEAPNLAGQNEIYLYNQLRAFRSGRRPHKEMLYMSRQLSDDDMRALAAYFAHLPPR